MTLNDILSIVSVGSEFIRLERDDKFSAMLSDLTEPGIYYNWIVTGLDISYSAGSLLVITIQEPETVSTYFSPDNSRFSPDSGG